MAGLVVNWAKRILRFVGYAVLVVFGLAVVGAFVPAIPGLGSMGPLLMASFGPLTCLVSLLAAVLFGLRWFRLAGRGKLVMAGLASFAAVGSATIVTRQIATAKANGVEIDLAQTLGIGLSKPASAVPGLETYGYDGNTPLQLAIYPRLAKTGTTAAPVLVYIHGGGWGGGTLHDRQADMIWFADKGYLVLSVEYTLSSKARPTWNIAQPQLSCALAWINTNAARLGGDASRLALLGESAGGNLVLNLAYLSAAGKLAPSCPGTLPHIAAVVAPYPVIDALRMYANRDLIAGPFARMMTTNYTGGTPATYPDRYAAISSGTHINPAAPPTLLLPGMADHLLPLEVAEGFAARAKAAGITVRLIAFPYGEHSFDQGDGSVGSQLFRQASLQFLAEHGMRPGPGGKPD